MKRVIVTRSAVRGALRNPVRALLIGAIRGYQLLVSPGLPSRCKYYPSCSQYAVDAIQEYGPARGFVLAIWRILRCNPLSYGGYDPVSSQKLFRRRHQHREAALAPPPSAKAWADAPQSQVMPRPHGLGG